TCAARPAGAGRGFRHASIGCPRERTGRRVLTLFAAVTLPSIRTFAPEGLSGPRAFVLRQGPEVRACLRDCKRRDRLHSKGIGRECSALRPSPRLHGAPWHSASGDQPRWEFDRVVARPALKFVLRVEDDAHTVQ